MRRILRRHLVRFGRKSGDPAIALRFHAAARLVWIKPAPRSPRARPRTFDGRPRNTPLHRGGQRAPLQQAPPQRNLKIGDAFRRHLIRLLQRTPKHFGWRRPTWTRGVLRPQMQRDDRPVVAVCTIGRALSRISATRLAETDRALLVATREAGARPRLTPRARSRRERGTARALQRRGQHLHSIRRSDATGCFGTISAASCYHSCRCPEQAVRRDVYKPPPS